MNTQDEQPLLSETTITQPVNQERQQSRFRKEIGEFLSWRWRWLVNILVLFYIPVVILVPPKFVLWISLLITGFVYVAGVTCNRHDPLLSRRAEKGARELVKLLFCAPFLFLLGPYWTLLDENGGVSPSPTLLTFLFNDSAILESFHHHTGRSSSSLQQYYLLRTSTPLSSSLSMDYCSCSNDSSLPIYCSPLAGQFEDIVFFEGFDHGPVKRSGPLYYFIYNYFCYIIPFFIGIHITYLDYFPFLQAIVINSEGIKRLTRSHWIFIASALSLIVFLLGYHVYLFVMHGKWLLYTACACVLLAFFGSAVYYHMARRKRTIHIHHYQIGVLLLVFTPFQNTISAICQGISAGIFVEGITRWGMDPTFV